MNGSQLYFSGFLFPSNIAETFKVHPPPTHTHTSQSSLRDNFASLLSLSYLGSCCCENCVHWASLSDLNPFSCWELGSILVGAELLQPLVCQSWVLQCSLLRTESPVSVPMLQFILSHVYFLWRSPTSFHAFWSCSFFLSRTRSILAHGAAPEHKYEWYIPCYHQNCLSPQEAHRELFPEDDFLLGVFCIFHANIFLAEILTTNP